MIFDRPHRTIRDCIVCGQKFAATIADCCSLECAKVSFARPAPVRTFTPEPLPFLDEPEPEPAPPRAPLASKPCVKCGQIERYTNGQCAPCQRGRMNAKVVERLRQLARRRAGQ